MGSGRVDADFDEELALEVGCGKGDIPMRLIVCGFIAVWDQLSPISLIDSGFVTVKMVRFVLRCCDGFVGR